MTVENTNTNTEINSEVFDEELFPDQIDVKPNLNFLDHIKSDKKEFENWRDVDDSNRELAFLSKKEKDLARKRINMINHIDSVFETINSAIKTKKAIIKAKSDDYVLKHTEEMHEIESDESNEDKREMLLEHSKVTVIHRTILKTEINKEEPQKGAA